MDCFIIWMKQVGVGAHTQVFSPAKLCLELLLLGCRATLINLPIGPVCQLLASEIRKRDSCYVSAISLRTQAKRKPYYFLLKNNNFSKIIITTATTRHFRPKLEKRLLIGKFPSLHPKTIPCSRR